MSNTTLADRRSDDEDSEGIEINLNHGDEDETTEQDKDEDNMPNAIALESSLEFAQR